MIAAIGLPLIQGKMLRPSSLSFPVLIVTARERPGLRDFTHWDKVTELWGEDTLSRSSAICAAKAS